MLSSNSRSASQSRGGLTLSFSIDQAAIAQLGECQNEDLKVPGAIPGLGIAIPILGVE